MPAHAMPKSETSFYAAAILLEQDPEGGYCPAMHDGFLGIGIPVLVYSSCQFVGPRRKPARVGSAPGIPTSAVAAARVACRPASFDLLVGGYDSARWCRRNPPANRLGTRDSPRTVGRAGAAPARRAFSGHNASHPRRGFWAQLAGSHDRFSSPVLVACRFGRHRAAAGSCSTNSRDRCECAFRPSAKAF